VGGHPLRDILDVRVIAHIPLRPPRLYFAVPFVYILRCRDGSLYTGAAKSLESRLARHRAGTASKYTRSRLPVTLVWKRRVRSWSAALKAERRIKGLDRSAKLDLVTGAVRRK
jgi:putative endonuclease